MATLAPASAQEAPSDPLDGLPALPLQVGHVADQNDPRSAKPRIAAQVAAPIAPDELRSYALVLRLSEAQRSFVRDAYLAYRAKVDKLYADYNQPIGDLAYAAADRQSQQADWEFLRLLTEMRAIEARFDKELLALDAAFLVEIQTVLAEPQLVAHVRPAHPVDHHLQGLRAPERAVSE